MIIVDLNVHGAADRDDFHSYEDKMYGNSRYANQHHKRRPLADTDSMSRGIVYRLLGQHLPLYTFDMINSFLELDDPIEAVLAGIQKLNDQALQVKAEKAKNKKSALIEIEHKVDQLNAIKGLLTSGNYQEWHQLFNNIKVEREENLSEQYDLMTFQKNKYSELSDQTKKDTLTKIAFRECFSGYRSVINMYLDNAEDRLTFKLIYRLKDQAMNDLAYLDKWITRFDKQLNKIKSFQLGPIQLVRIQSKTHPLLSKLRTFVEEAVRLDKANPKTLFSANKLSDLSKESVTTEFIRKANKLVGSLTQKHLEDKLLEAVANHSWASQVRAAPGVVKLKSGSVRLLISSTKISSHKKDHEDSLWELLEASHVGLLKYGKKGMATVESRNYLRGL